MSKYVIRNGNGDYFVGIYSAKTFKKNIITKPLFKTRKSLALTYDTATAAWNALTDIDYLMPGAQLYIALCEEEKQ